MTVNEIPTLSLSDDVELPAIGYGVFQTAPDETVAAVTEALRVGYRHVDTAAAYGNEREVGDALRRSEVDRADVVVETKVWASDYGYDETLHAFEKASAKLGLDQIDVLILHQVAANLFDRTIEAYRALERLLADGRVRAIGVSNFPVARLERLMDATDVVPHLNQVELHPYHSQPELQAFHRQHGILTQAWSPIGGITFYPGPWGDDRRSVMQDPAIGEIAATHGVSPAQVMLRWHVQQGRSAIPKSVNPDRIRQNLDVTGFTLSADELARVDALDTGTASGPDPEREFDERQLFPIPEPEPERSGGWGPRNEAPAHRGAQAQADQQPEA
ncbi:aldo/keto reductase [Cellulosimicrobium sp. CUA-896]|uniref:aldo/keto reductase n=1 Tax=Cellulosimicrobium sp. CUA-896 TaxID=1517881 RepID=UPI00095E84BC|nr:aldo/keto reductase [Cellulosimicrobium sp. CUA-896]OLT52283.1 oxidoreductase [Cellulosimicrobium sp. CUA-896]